MLDTMKNKIIMVTISICIVAIYIICMLLSDLKTQKEESSRQYNNFRTMSDSSKYFKDKYGSIVLEKGTLELEVGEFKNSKNKEISILKNYISDLNIKLKNIPFEINQRGYFVNLILFFLKIFILYYFIF